MLLNNWRTVLALSLLLGLVVTQWHSSAEEPQTKPLRQTNFTHVLPTETTYYITGPQQGRPEDGKFPAGTKVKLLRTLGSYSQVRSDKGIVAYVLNDALKETGAKTVEITENAKKVAQSTNQFAFDLYKRLRNGEDNLFFSPASISTALAMTYAGAEGQTERQMAQVLHFDVEEALLHDGFGTFGKILNSRNKGYQLNMANRLWGQKSYPFNQEFLTTTEKDYGAKLAQVDFAQSEQARQQINAWVEEQTQGKIENLIPSGVLGSATRMVLTNAIYFKGTWVAEFSKKATSDSPFHLSQGKKIDVPTMNQTKMFPYAEADGLQVLELPYGGEDLSMIVLLPKKKDGLADWESKLSAQTVKEWTKNLRKREVNVSLPKFKMTSEFRLADVLHAMGMTLAFSEQADFSGISTAEDLMISEVIHKAFVDVNEEGTEAAAATGVVVRVTAAFPQEPVVFQADHPFMFLIRDNRTDAVLFLGRVMNPKE